MPSVEPLTDAERADALAALPDWSGSGPTLSRSVKVADFRAAVALVNAVADAAEAANHHPDVCITGYRYVSFELSTHAAKALTRRDIDLARAINRCVDDAAAVGSA